MFGVTFIQIKNAYNFRAIDIDVISTRWRKYKIQHFPLLNDSLKWEFIFKIFECYGFGDNFMRFLKTVYNTPKCCIINNNHMSSFFEVSTSVRQGDPLSPTIFVLSMQCLANVLKQDTIYKGVIIDQETLKFTMFADDILLFLSGTNDQFSRIFDVLLEFFNHSNCKINLSKCQAFNIGSNRNCVDKLFIDKGLKWPTETFKYLGVLVPVKKCYDNAKKLVELNLVPLLNKMKNILSLWSSRNLTLMGKITIVKSLIIPRMIYKVSILPLIIPKTLITKINKLLFKFIWGSNWERVSRNVLCNIIESGGAKILHLESYLTALHVKSLSLLFDETYCSQWKFIENLFFDRNLLSAILLSNIKISSKTIQRLLPLRLL